MWKAQGGGGGWGGTTLGGGGEGAGLRDKGPSEVEYGGCGAPCAIAGRRWEEVKRRLDTTKMFLMSEAEERGEGGGGWWWGRQGGGGGRPRMKADVRSPEESPSVKPSNGKEEYV